MNQDDTIRCACGNEVVDAKRVDLPHDNIQLGEYDCAGTTTETHLHANRENETYAVGLMLFKHKDD